MRNLTALVAAAGIVFALTAVPAQADQAAALKAMAKSKIITWAQDPKVVAAIKAQNTKHASLDQASTIKLDKQWRAESTQKFQSQVSVAISDGGKVIGAVTVGVNVDEL
jgi:hypothetical protein